MKVVGEQSLGTRDLDILEVLTRRVRLLSLDQIAMAWWGATARPRANASRRLLALERRGLLQRLTVMAHPPPGLESPLASWRPGEPAPDVASIAYRLETRWQTPLEPTVAAVATRAAGARLGGVGGKVPRESETSHDLGLAALFLRFRDVAPSLAASWVHEGVLGSGTPDGFQPDAMLLDVPHRKAIEFAGTYDKHRLARLHEACCREALPYELW